jgi:hypothetical protein
MKYDKFYFFHMDKTIGRLTGIHMFDPLYRVMNRYGIDTEINSEHSRHNLWLDMPDSTYMFSTIRDPFHRTIAEFCYSSLYSDLGYRQIMEGARDNKSNLLTAEKLQIWLDEKFIPNHQYKIFSSNTFDEKLVLNRINRVNFLIQTESFNNNEADIQNKILKDLGISEKMPKYNKDLEYSFYQEVINEFINNNKIWNSDLHLKIKKANYLDEKLYELVQIKPVNFI